MTFKIVKGRNTMAEVKSKDRDWFFDLHDDLKWTYARTMPFAPHSYVWYGRNITERDFDCAFGVIRTFGEPGKYWDRTQLYLHNRERNIRYWLMGRGFIECLIINMATDGKDYGVQDAPSTVIDGWSEYDAIAPWWDEIYREFDEFDRTTLWKLVHQNASLVRPSMLDIGAGTGAALDANIAPSAKTTAIDPSQGMLNDLVVKYPMISVFPGTMADFIEGHGIQKHNIVMASTGSASYLTPEEIRAAHHCAEDLLVLSFYASVPTHREELPETHAYALAEAKELSGAVAMTHGNFIHVISRGT